MTDGAVVAIQQRAGLGITIIEADSATANKRFIGHLIGVHNLMGIITMVVYCFLHMTHAIQGTLLKTGTLCHRNM